MNGVTSQKLVSGDTRNEDLPPGVRTWADRIRIPALRGPSKVPHSHGGVSVELVTPCSGLAALSRTTRVEWARRPTVRPPSLRWWVFRDRVYENRDAGSDASSARRAGHALAALNAGVTQSMSAWYQRFENAVLVADAAAPAKVPRALRRRLPTRPVHSHLGSEDGGAATPGGKPLRQAVGHVKRTFEIGIEQCRNVQQAVCCALPGCGGALH
mmetsp:Transcript_80629/g.215242  ORF Transcript_80629/g.215242 Transcript_80629/m.215242 type:complete len:213 (+) Transcript_80629:82-720(+)